MIYLKANDNSYVTNKIYNVLLDRNIYNTLGNIKFSWLMIFTNDFTKERFTVIQIMHQSALRYNRNMVVLPILAKVGGTAANGLIQKISFDNYGYYSYEIYWQNSITNLNPDNIPDGLLVQTGKALVAKENEVIDYAAQKDGNPNNFIYVP